MARVLGVVRLSRDKDESTSVVRQRQAVETWAQQNGHTVVDWAQDLDVSGSVAPWERQELGQWLPSTIGKDASPAAQERAWTESRAAEFDILCAWRLDRVTRRVLHLAGLVEWSNAHGKGLVSASEGFDITSGMGRVFVQILAALAEGELEAIRERSRSSFTHLTATGRWRGGFVPYGYRTVKAATGEGWRLDIDEETSAVVRDIAERIIAGESANSVTRSLNEQGVPIPLDAQRLRAGKTLEKRGEWRVGNLLKMLRSHTLQGHSEVTEKHQGTDGKTTTATRVVRGENGLPLQRAEPILDRETWERLQAALDTNGSKRTGSRSNGSLLLQVAFCACGEPMYAAQGRGGVRYYRCGLRGRASKACGIPGMRADEAEGLVVENFLRIVGDLEATERVLIPGNDHAADLEDVERALSELREDRAAGLYRGDKGDRDYRAMYVNLEDRREALEALPASEDEWHDIGTGVTYRQRWEALETDTERARVLRSAGVRLTVGPKSAEGEEVPRIAFALRQDIRERVGPAFA